MKRLRPKRTNGRAGCSSRQGGSQPTYTGFDIHKRYTFYTQMDVLGQVQQQGKLTNSHEALAELFVGVAEPSCVVIAASMNWYHSMIFSDSDIPVMHHLGSPRTPRSAMRMSGSRVRTGC